MNIWILQTGEPLHIDPGNPRPMRAMNLANFLVESGHRVVLWSAAFNHQEKHHRTQVFERITVSPQLEIRLIPSPGYGRNIGLARLWDHAVLAYNLARLLKQEAAPPDVAFIGFPPIEVAAVMTHWLHARGAPCILDIKDQWPNIFVNALPRTLRPLGYAVFAPYFYYAKRAMRDATGLSAMADEFLTWAIEFSRRTQCAQDIVVPLTTPNGQVSGAELDAARIWWDSKGILADDRPRVCFVGSHSPAFDIEPIYQAAKHFSTSCNPCEFVICGSGEFTSKWKTLMSCLPNVHFPGWVDRAQIEVLAERSLAALTPYHNVDNFTKNLPNKVIDAFSLGLPILSPLRGEVANLIKKYGIGLSYGSDLGVSLYEVIELLISNKPLRHEMSISAINLYNQRFSFELVYGGLTKHLEKLALLRSRA